MASIVDKVKSAVISSPIATVYEKAAGEDTTIATERDDTKLMKVAAWHGMRTVKIDQVGRPKVTDATDAVLKVTSTAICGSDLHLYERAMPGMKNGDILGHEFMGIVEAVGPGVKTIKVGDRVVASFDIACGSCFFCNKGLQTSCDKTNPSAEQEVLYGARTGGFHGYSHLTGGWAGGQSEYARVPFADVNLLKLPHEGPDNKFLLISDVLATSWHSTELGEVGKGDIVAIWGAGPVGILAAHCSFVRGAARVILIDEVQFRLDFAKARIPGLETLNFKEEKNIVKKLHDITDSHGPDVGIEAVGFHYGTTILHTVERALQLETDPSEIINEIIYSVRKGGRISIVGVYSGFTNHFNIGAFMEKGQNMRAGQTPVQKYWHKLLDLILEGTLKPDMIVTHNLPLEEAPKGFQIFNDKSEGCVKVVLKPHAITA